MSLHFTNRTLIWFGAFWGPKINMQCAHFQKNLSSSLISQLPTPPMAPPLSGDHHRLSQACRFCYKVGFIFIHNVLCFKPFSPNRTFDAHESNVSICYYFILRLIPLGNCRKEREKVAKGNLTVPVISYIFLSFDDVDYSMFISMDSFMLA